MPLLAEWWPNLIDHAEQSRLWWSPARHRPVAAGRGGGKSENAARILIGGDEHHRGAINCPRVAKPLYVVAAPTRDQVRAIWWDKLKAMVPIEFLAAEPRESDLTIRLRSGATIQLVGLDKPHRTEGIAIDGLVVDEYAEVKASAWSSSLEPALNRVGRPGWALFIGRPKGRGHFYDLWSKAKTAGDEWDSFHWTSEPVLGSEALRKIEANCDPLTFRQEYLADWVNFTGLAYYPWNPNDHYRALAYDPSQPLIFCLDFNVEPGAAVVLQEQFVDVEGKKIPPEQLTPTSETTTCVIGQVHIPRNSNTVAVSNRLVADWGHHAGDVRIYGDPSGGARHTSQRDGGTDWQIVREILTRRFGDRLAMRIAKRAPHIRDRVNSVNTRLKSTSGKVRLAVDPQKAPAVIKDFEGVTLLEGGSGEIDKKGCEANGLTHWSEALGYYIHEKHPIQDRVFRIEE